MARARTQHGGMVLMTDAELARIPEYTAERVTADTLAVAHMFAPIGGWSWYVTSASRSGDDIICYGLVRGFETELGPFSIRELESLKLSPLGLHIERSLHWTPMPLKNLCPEMFQRRKRA